MSDFDAEKFEDKYVHYFPELQTAYKNAFEYMNDRYDSELIHAIDQQILNESEPFYEGESESGQTGDSSGQSSGEPSGDFRVQLPEDPEERIRGVLVDDEKLEATLEEYVDRIEAELRKQFGFE